MRCDGVREWGWVSKKKTTDLGSAQGFLVLVQGQVGVHQALEGINVLFQMAGLQEDGGGRVGPAQGQEQGALDVVGQDVRGPHVQRLVDEGQAAFLLPKPVAVQRGGNPGLGPA